MGSSPASLAGETAVSAPRHILKTIGKSIDIESELRTCCHLAAKIAFAAKAIYNKYLKHNNE
jgi:hypothetical protein